MDAKEFGCFVADRRKELKMTQKELAAKIQVTDKAVSNALNIAEQEVKSSHRILAIIYAVTAFICSIVEMLFSINWSGESLTMTAEIPYCAIVPGIVMILYAAICKVRGQKAGNFLTIGICLIFIPTILVFGIFLVLGVIVG